MRIVTTVGPIWDQTRVRISTLITLIMGELGPMMVVVVVVTDPSAFCTTSICSRVFDWV